jgi:hypothetical protein
MDYEWYEMGLMALMSYQISRIQTWLCTAIFWYDMTCLLFDTAYNIAMDKLLTRRSICFLE